MMDVSNPPVKKTSSGVVYAGPCVFHGFLISTDGVNDVIVTFYDNASAASGQEIVPTNTYDATAKALNGATGMKVRCQNGIYLELTCAGMAGIVPQFAPL